MGIINFVRRFVHDFSLMVKPIHNLLKKYHSFSWIDDVENDFVRVKKEINSTSFLVKQILRKSLLYTLMPQRK